MQSMTHPEKPMPETDPTENSFIHSFNALAERNHAAMEANGFWEMRHAIPEGCECWFGTGEKSAAAQRAVDIQDLALMHEEISEAVSYVRKTGDAMSDHIAEFTGVEEELADCILRIMDFSAGRNLRIGDALVAKMRYNLTRPHRHGKQC